MILHSWFFFLPGFLSAEAKDLMLNSLLLYEMYIHVYTYTKLYILTSDCLYQNTYRMIGLYFFCCE